MSSNTHTVYVVTVAEPHEMDVGLDCFDHEEHAQNDLHDALVEVTRANGGTVALWAVEVRESQLQTVAERDGFTLTEWLRTDYFRRNGSRWSLRDFQWDLRTLATIARVK